LGIKLRRPTPPRFKVVILKAVQSIQPFTKRYGADLVHDLLFSEKAATLKAAYLQVEAWHERARHVLATLQSFNRPQKQQTPLTVSR